MDDASGGGDGTWKSVTYGNGLFVAVCSMDFEYNTCGTLMTSSDGVTWTSRTSATSSEWESVTYGNGLFVAVDGSSNAAMMVSPDGMNWALGTTTEAGIGGLSPMVMVDLLQ